MNNILAFWRAAQDITGGSHPIIFAHLHYRRWVENSGGPMPAFRAATNQIFDRVRTNVEQVRTSLNAQWDTAMAALDRKGIGPFEILAHLLTGMVLIMRNDTHRANERAVQRLRPA